MSEKFKKHPTYPVTINEDGTKIFKQGIELKICTYISIKRGVPVPYVWLSHRMRSVSRLVCEAWNGLAPEEEMHASHIGDIENHHYTNLAWTDKGNPINRESSNSKIPTTDIPKVIERLKNGETQASIAKSYGTSSMSISRIKKKYL